MERLIFASVCEPKQKVKCSKFFTVRATLGFRIWAPVCNLKTDSLWAGVICPGMTKWCRLLGAVCSSLHSPSDEVSKI